MSKFRLLIMSLCAALWACVLSAQTPMRMTLDELFDRAEEHSARLATERKAMDEASAAVREARAARLPNLDLTLSASYLGNGCLTDRDFGNGQNISMPHWGNNFAIEASQLIYGGGAVQRQIDLARQAEQLSSLHLSATRSEVRFVLTGYYLELCKLENLLQVYDQHIALTERLIADTRLRHAQGLVLQNDITRFELQIEELRLARTRVENARSIIQSDLRTTLHLPAETLIVPDTTSLASPYTMEGEGCWQASAEESSHAIRQSELGVEMSRTSEKLARAARRPKVSLFAANHFDGPITIEVPVINKNFNYWMVGVGVSVPLSALYKSNKSIRRAEQHTAYSERRLIETEEQVEQAIRSDYIRYREAFTEVETWQKSVELALENYAVVENRYRNDVALITDMLDASAQKLEAELQLTNARINTRYRYYKLCFVAGTL